jgi:quinol monooxygenase YgiN
MRTQIINFQLKDLEEKAFNSLCDQLAPTFAEVPGLISKVWLSNSQTNTYGGVYSWRDAAAMQVFLQSDLCRSIMSNPHFTNITSTDFAVLEAPTHVTRGSALAAVA